MTLEEKAAVACRIRYQTPEGEKSCPGSGEKQWAAGYREALADVQTFIDMHLKDYPNSWAVVAYAIMELGK